MPRLLCLGFDGVLHAYSTWKGPELIDGRPVHGAINALILYQQNFVVAVYSARSAYPQGRKAMMTFLYENGIGFDMIAWNDAFSETKGDALDYDIQPIRFPTTKPPAEVTIDDRSYPPWNGVFPSVDELLNFHPWWQGSSGQKL